LVYFSQKFFERKFFKNKKANLLIWTQKKWHRGITRCLGVLWYVSSPLDLETWWLPSSENTELCGQHSHHTHTKEKGWYHVVQNYNMGHVFLNHVRGGCQSSPVFCFSKTCYNLFEKLASSWYILEKHDL